MENYEPEESVASILMSLSGSPKSREKTLAAGSSAKALSSGGDDSSKRFAAEAIERIKSEISATLSDDEELEMNSDLLMKDKSACSGADLEMIRRERNRMHAKKTRLRKKKMLSEMESVSFRLHFNHQNNSPNADTLSRFLLPQIIHGLERDIRELRQRHSLGPDEYTSGMDFRRRPAGSLTISGAIGGSKFTGFRHVHRSDGGALKGLASGESVHSSSSVSSGNSSSHSGNSGNTSSGSGGSTGFESMAFMLKATTSSIKESELGLNTNPPFPMLYSQAFTTTTTSSSSGASSSKQGDSATTTPAQSTSGSGNDSGGSSRNSGEYNQYVPSGALHGSGITPSASTGSLESSVGGLESNNTKYMNKMDCDSVQDIQGAADRLVGRSSKRSSSELSSGATSRAASMDDMDGGGSRDGGEQQCAGILCLAATAAAERGDE